MGKMESADTADKRQMKVLPSNLEKGTKCIVTFDSKITLWHDGQVRLCLLQNTPYKAVFIEAKYANAWKCETVCFWIAKKRIENFRFLSNICGIFI